MYNRELIDYLPPIIRDVREMKIIMNAEQPEMVKLWDSVDQALSDQFIEDAGEYGVARWEKGLGIVPKATETLDARKFTILTRINEQLPFTMRTLENQLKTLCGEDGYTLVLDHQNYSLNIQVALVARSNFDDVVQLLNRVVPANMVVTVTIKYNQHETLSTFTHGQLSQYIHDDIRNEVLT